MVSMLHETHRLSLQNKDHIEITFKKLHVKSIKIFCFCAMTAKNYSSTTRLRVHIY